MNKSVSIKTMSKWWKIFERSALFIYLIQKHGFHQLPADTDDDSFVDDLLCEKNDPSELLRFLGAYAHLVETFMKAKSDLFYVSVPEFDTSDCDFNSPIFESRIGNNQHVS